MSTFRVLSPPERERLGERDERSGEKGGWVGVGPEKWVLVG